MLTYSKNGNFEETAQLEIDAPSFNTFKESSALSQCFVRALFANRKMMQDNNQDDSAAQGDNDLDANAVQLLLMASDVDFSDILDVFVNLCVKSCTLDQERKINIKKDHFNKLAYQDVVNFICEYVANFTVPSVLSGMNTAGK
jgi:hypothetical protein